MRIVYLHQYFNTPQMSGGTRSYEMARRLVAAGHQVHMITTDRSPQARAGWRVTEEAGIIVHWLPVPYSNRMAYSERIKAFGRFAWYAARRAAAFPADVVFATSTPLTIALPAVYAARRQKIPMVFEVRDLWPELPIAVGALKGPLIPPARWLERFAFRNASYIVALSPGMKEGIARQGVSPERIFVIPNSADIALFSVGEEAGRAFRSQFEWLQDRPLILYAGTLGRINGVGYLAEIAARMAHLDAEVRFMVIGDGYEKASIIERAKSLGVLNRNFFLLPSLPKKEMPAVYSAATIATSLVIDLPALWANSANKFFDALAAGKPIAINYNGWQADLLRETGAGIVMPPADAEAAAQQLAELVHDHERLVRAGAAAQKLAEERFDRDRLAAELEAVLTKAVATA